MKHFEKIIAVITAVISILTSIVTLVSAVSTAANAVISSGKDIRGQFVKTADKEVDKGAA